MTQHIIILPNEMFQNVQNYDTRRVFVMKIQLLEVTPQRIFRVLGEVPYTSTQETN
jgi:hypothetical protein